MTLMPGSLRWRLALAFAGVAALGVGLFAGALLLLVERAVWAPLDAGLTEEAETLGGLADLPPERLAEAVRGIGAEEDLGPGKFVRVEAPDHRILAQYREVPPAVARRRPAAVDRLALLSVDAEPDPYRVAWAPGPGGGAVVLGVAAGRQALFARRARTAIAATAAGLVALLSVLAWAVTSRATTDLTRLAAELETIEAGSLDRRLTARATTEVDRLVAVLNRMLERLDAAVTTLTRFTADAAHELRTPVAALRAHLESSIARAATLEDSRAGLLDALAQAERLGRLSEDLLTLNAVESGPGGGCEEPVRLDELVREAAEFLAPVAEDQARPFVCDATAPVTVRGAPTLLKRVVLNLVDNAFRHTPEGTPVRVRLSAHDGLARLEVEDAGPGMSGQALASAFERFRKGSGDGAGLGLALVREIVGRHHGRVSLGNRPEGGTTATVLLPLAPATAG